MNTNARHRCLGAFVAFLAFGLSACGGGGGSASTPEPLPLPPLAGNLAVPGAHVVKMRAQGSTWIVLAEKPRPHEDNTAPDRHLLLAPPGATQPLGYRPPADWSLIDAALHPSGETTVVLATAKRLRLQRLGARGQLLSDAEFRDPQAATDPMFYEYGPYAHDSSALLPFPTRDAVRIAPLGESLVMALRTGRQATVAYGLRDDRPAGYALEWRTLVEPGVGISAEAYRGGSGTFDPFGSMENQYHLALDTDAQGRIGIAMVVDRTELLYGHRQMFGESSIPAAFEHGVLVTQLSRDGLRLGALAVDTLEMSELHGARWSAGHLVLTGRVRTEVRADGGGWNAFVGRVAADTQRLADYAVVDVDRGDIFFDAVTMSDGRLLLAGSTGYIQNPSGRSVSEAAWPLLVVCAPGCPHPTRLEVAAGPRHNQLRALAQWAGRWWVGGMEDGAGTHTDDADPSGLRSSGYVRAVPA